MGCLAHPLSGILRDVQSRPLSLFLAACVIGCAESPTPLSPPPRSEPVTAPDPAPAPQTSDDAGAKAVTTTKEPATFEDDLAFLNAHSKGTKLLVLRDADGGAVALSPLYQGRVMTSAVDPKGQSFGFLNRAFIEAGKTGTQFDNFGGEEWFWLGPEGGQ